MEGRAATAAAPPPWSPPGRPRGRLAPLAPLPALILLLAPAASTAWELDVAPHRLPAGRGGELLVRSPLPAGPGARLTLEAARARLEGEQHLPAAPSGPAPLAEAAGRLFVALGEAGLWVLDPVRSLYLERRLPGPAGAVAAGGDRLLVLAGRRLLLRRPADPGPVRAALELPAAGRTLAVDRQGRRAAVALGDGRLLAVAVEAEALRPLAPLRLERGRLQGRGAVRALAWAGGILLALRGEGGGARVEAWRLREGRLEPRGTLPTPGALDLAPWGKGAAVALGEGGLLLLRLEEGRPVWAGSRSRPPAHRLAASAERLLALDGRGRLYAFAREGGRPRLAAFWAGPAADTPPPPAPPSPAAAVQILELGRRAGGRVAAVLAGRRLRLVVLPEAAPRLDNQALDEGRGVNYGGQRRANLRRGILHVADWFSGVHLYDVRHPRRPRLLATLHTPGSPKGIALRGDLAYVADDDHGLRVLEVSDPRRPREVGAVTLPGLAYTPRIEGDRLYLAAHRGGLHVLDLADPTRPRLLATVPTPGYAWGVDVAEGIAFVAADEAGLAVYDLRDPARPRRLAVHRTAGRAEDVRLRGRLAYVATFDAGVEVVDVSDPARPRRLALLPTRGAARGLDLRGRSLYVAEWRAGVSRWSLADPARPRLEARLDTPGAAWGVVASRRAVFVLDWWGGLLAADPRLGGASRYAGRGEVADLAARGRRLLSAEGAGGLQLYDVQNPLNPTWVTGLDLPEGEEARALDWPEEALACAATSRGLRVLAVGPFALRERGRWELPGGARAVLCRAGRAWLAGEEELVVLNLADPARPRPLARLAWRARALAWLELPGGGRVLALPEDGRPRLLDPARPEEASAALALPFPARRWAVSGPWLALAGGRRVLLGRFEDGASGPGLAELARLSLPAPAAALAFRGPPGRPSGLAVALERGGLRLFALGVHGRPLPAGRLPLLDPARALRVHRPAGAPAPREAIHGEVIYAAGARHPVALKPPPAPEVRAEAQDRWRVRLPKGLPEGDYVLVLRTAGGAPVARGELRLTPPRFGKPALSREAFRRLLERHRRQAGTAAPPSVRKNGPIKTP